MPDRTRHQHFLLCPRVRTISLAQVLRMSAGEAEETFAAIRWAETSGRSVCPVCGWDAVCAPRPSALAQPAQVGVAAAHAFDSARACWMTLARSVVVGSIVAIRSTSACRSAGSRYSPPLTECHVEWA